MKPTFGGRNRPCLKLWDMSCCYSCKRWWRIALVVLSCEKTYICDQGFNYSMTIICFIVLKSHSLPHWGIKPFICSLFRIARPLLKIAQRCFFWLYIYTRLLKTENYFNAYVSLCTNEIFLKTCLKNLFLKLFSTILLIIKLFQKLIQCKRYVKHHN